MTQPQQQQQTKPPTEDQILQQQYPGARRLQPGVVLQEDDLYFSTSGKWEKVPCPGAKIPDNDVQFARIYV